MEEYSDDELAVSIPLEQGNVLRLLDSGYCTLQNLSQSLWNRAMSYDAPFTNKLTFQLRSQSLWNRAMSYDTLKKPLSQKRLVSQSLWNRAMSYDEPVKSNVKIWGLNPFGTGQCLTTVVGS